jgi:hypothetical protein
VPLITYAPKVATGLLNKTVNFSDEKSLGAVGGLILLIASIIVVGLTLGTLLTINSRRLGIG